MGSKKVKVFTVGTDPEFMIRKKSGALVSAIGIIDGDKHNPIKLDNGSMLQYDNVNLEFATKVAGSMHDFVDKIRSTYKTVAKLLPKNHYISATPSAMFPAAELQTIEAQEFGCNPDFNAWTLMVNPSPEIDPDATLRSCGGHIHVGQKKGYEFLKDPEGKVLTVQVMDAILGIISVIYDNDLTSRRRRELYGKAGCHRPTEYGVEYRVLSNFWLKNPWLVRLMYSLTRDALEIIDSELGEKLIYEIGEEEIIECIDNSHVWKAQAILRNHISPLLSGKSKFMMKKIDVDIHAIRRNDIGTNWELGTGIV